MQTSIQGINPRPSTWGAAPANSRLVCSTYGPYATLTDIKIAAGAWRQRDQPSEYVPVTTTNADNTSTAS